MGQATERGYLYRAVTEQDGVRFQLLTALSDPAGNVSNGVVLGEGDGTIPLLSLGYMCADGWQRPELNPSFFFFF